MNYSQLIAKRDSFRAMSKLVRPKSPKHTDKLIAMADQLDREAGAQLQRKEQ